MIGGDREHGSIEAVIAAHALASEYDALLLDLDGVVYVGRHAVPGAAAALEALAAAGSRVSFVTNNASRTAEQVAEQLRGFGLPVSASDVLTSAMVGAGLVTAQVPVGATVLAVGGEGVAAALRDAGFEVIDALLDPPDANGDDVAAVLQGYGPDVNWRALARASFAVARGVPWIATNTDLTIPVEGGIAPGNGTFVAAVSAATGRSPEVAGKPHPPLFRRAATTCDAHRPLVVGDRLDTDIEGAANSGMDAVLVLSGVSHAADLWRAPASQRPRHLAKDLSGLLAAPLVASLTDGVAHCGPATARIEAGSLRIVDGGDPLAAIWAAAQAIWDYGDLPADAIAIAEHLDEALERAD